MTKSSPVNFAQYDIMPYNMEILLCDHGLKFTVTSLYPVGLYNPKIPHRGIPPGWETLVLFYSNDV